MAMTKAFGIVPVLLVLFSLLSCGVNWSDMALAGVLRPEDAKEFDPKGGLFYFTVNSAPDSGINGFVIMFRDAPDLSVPLNNGIEGFALDVPTNCTGISRIGLRYSVFGDTRQYWFRDSEYTFSVRTNAVNYLGRFLLVNLMTYEPGFSLRVSNVLQKDRARFAEGYASQTNRPFVPVDLKKDPVR